ncbi:hypothetical protein BJ508DRAFT_419570 [Ascobolus immersus RN42]|uniref:F-box domain-containing protein n=1 Tax=Ascobolus immersus RN42 TaxID=1160509 RepID=A0A3N4HJ45_ASCIM|nr:hypothetical protein BJ508DRAFT_419570 [Ascobolus immersus RN42]
MPPTSFLALPDELHFSISYHLHITSFLVLQQTCRRLNELYAPLKNPDFFPSLALELESSLEELPSRFLPRQTIKPDNICTFLLNHGLLYLRPFTKVWTSQKKQRAQRLKGGDEAYEIEKSTGRFWRKMLATCLYSFAWDLPAAVHGSEAERKALEVLRFLLTDWTSGVDELYAGSQPLEGGVLGDGRFGADLARRIVAEVQHLPSAKMCVQLGGLEVEARPGEEVDPEREVLFLVARSGDAEMMRWLVGECHVDVGVEDGEGRGVGYYVVEIPRELRVLLEEEWEEGFERFVQGKEGCLRMLVEGGMRIDGGRVTALQHLFRQGAFESDYLLAMKSWKGIPGEIDIEGYVWRYLERMAKLLLELGANPSREHVSLEEAESVEVDVWDSMRRYDRGSFKDMDYEQTEEDEELVRRCGIIGQVLLWGARPTATEEHRAVALRILTTLAELGVRFDLDEASALSVIEDGRKVVKDDGNEVLASEAWGNMWSQVEAICSEAGVDSKAKAETVDEASDDGEVPLLVVVDA